MVSRIAARTSRVRILAAQRPSQLLFAAFLLLLLAAGWFAVSRSAVTASGFAPDVSTHIATGPSFDDARQVWTIPTPAPEVHVAPAPTVHVETTDWSALSLGVHGIAPVATPSNSAAHPAELDIAMSPGERRMLLASVKSGEPEGLPSPQGYTPGIVVIVPGGANSDGICR